MPEMKRKARQRHQRTSEVSQNQNPKLHHHEEEEEPPGALTSFSSRDPPAHYSDQRPSSRRLPFNQRKRDAVQTKLRLLKITLKPIPFCPTKTLNPTDHEALFKRLGIWEFANLELDLEIRSSLLTLLIANYDPSSHCSLVHGAKFKVTRADLARALNLPPATKNPDSGADRFSDECVSVISDFVSDRVLLHGDTWEMPYEIEALIQCIREGQLQRLNWGKLIWIMVEKELEEVLESGFCYYASHLQRLMKIQRPDFFEDEELLAVEQPARLRVGHDENDVDGNAQFLRHRNFSGIGSWASEYVKRGEEKYDNDSDDDEEENGNDCDDEEERLEFSNAERVAMGTADSSNGSPVRVVDPSSCKDFMSSMVDAYKSVVVNVDEDNVGQFLNRDHQKNMRNEGIRVHDKPVGFNICFQNMKCCLVNEKMDYEAKCRQFDSVQMSVQNIYKDISHRDDVIGCLRRSLWDEQQKSARENYRVQSEIRLMTRLIKDYQRALNQTQIAFSEYRERYPSPPPDEPLYKDVGEAGGLVRVTVELEKQRSEEQIEERAKHRLIEEMIEGFERDWFGLLDGNSNRLSVLVNKLQVLEERIGFLKERFG